MMHSPFFSPFSPYQKKNCYPPKPYGMLPHIPAHKQHSYVETKKEVPKETSSIAVENTDCFEIFGFKLYFDDLLILAMLFFLYKEESKDTYLFIALFLLLIG